MLQIQVRSHVRSGVPAATPSGRVGKTTASSEKAPTHSTSPTTGDMSVKFSRGQTIFTEGDKALHAYKVIEGAVRVSRILADGHRQILDFHMPGSTFGLEFSDRHSATAEAIGDVAVIRSHPTRIGEGVRSEQAHEMLSLLSQALTASYDHVAMLGHQGAKQRLASFLIQLAQKQPAETKAVNMPISRQDMADYLGLTIETTCRTLSDLKTSRVVSTPDRHHFIIHNMERLEAIAGGDS